MTITTFKNMKGLIHGSDPRRINCDREGTLNIGKAEIKVSANSIMPVLFYGATGEYEATFTDKDGNVYQLERVLVRKGLIQPPPATAVEFMELRCLLDQACDKIKELEKEICRLDHIFDTDSLNFLIK